MLSIEERIKIAKTAFDREFNNVKYLKKVIYSKELELNNLIATAARAEAVLSKLEDIKRRLDAGEIVVEDNPN